MDVTNVLCVLVCTFVCVTFIYKRYLKAHIEVIFVHPMCECNVSQNERCSSEFCPTKLKAKLIEKIKNAQQSIDIAMYNFTNYELFKQLLLKHRRGLTTIRVIVDRSTKENEEYRSKVMELVQNGE